MSNNNHKIVFLLLSLVVIFAILGWVVSFKLNEGTMEQADNKLSGQLTLIKVMENKPVPSKNKVIVTDRFVGELEKDSVVVAVSSNGEAYTVRSGTLLTDGMVIKSSPEEYSVYRIDSPTKSVSTN